MSPRALASRPLALAALLLATWACAQGTKSITTGTSSANLAATQADATDKSAAQYWGLGIEDYRRYQALMKGMRGSLSDPRISPLEVLGIHARDDAERRRYAEAYARVIADDTQRVLAFQREYEAAFHRLFPNLPAVDLGPQAAKPQGLAQALAAAPQLPTSGVRVGSPTPAGRPAVVSAGDRLIVFTASTCKPCDAVVQRATSLAAEGIRVDLYLVGAQHADEVRSYAKQHVIDPALVNGGMLTLNLDAGTFARVLPRKPELPAVVRRRGDAIAQLQASEL
jgi:integrating conjugative element protein (TIGR03759 family)